MATKKDTRSPAPHVADNHEQGARVNNLKDVSTLTGEHLAAYVGI
ncbi:MAG TPA: hypothetical protein VIS51_00825 [Solirubrobacterales bacterium]